MDNNNTKKTKGSAYTQPDYIKPKSKWTKKTTIWVIVIAVIVLGILAIIGGNNGWFKSKDMVYGKAVVDDYSTIEINEADVEVTEETIQSYLDNVVSAETTQEEITEGTVENGDTINLDFSGILEGAEEPFEGGTAESQSLTLGSGTMIDGFEDQIIGHEIGETFDIEVTFPEDYSSEDLAGQNATFTITINSKTQDNVPELTDELIQHYSEEHMDETINSIEDFKEYYRTTLGESRLENAILSAMTEKTHVKYYNEQDLANLTAYNENVISYYASMFGLGTADYAEMLGYESAEAYAEEQAKRTLDQTMMADVVADDLGITVTQEEVDEKLTEYMESEQYEGTLDEFKAASNEAYLFLVEKTDVLMPKVLDQLKSNVVMVESEETEEETSEAAVEEETTEAEEETTEAEEETTEAEEETTEADAEEDADADAEEDADADAEEEADADAEEEADADAEEEADADAEEEADADAEEEADADAEEDAETEKETTKK